MNNCIECLSWPSTAAVNTSPQKSPVQKRQAADQFTFATTNLTTLTVAAPKLTKGSHRYIAANQMMKGACVYSGPQAIPRSSVVKKRKCDSARPSVRNEFDASVVFRSAKDRLFAERKGTKKDAF
jgi:hypothetical protein